jgi:hypothetical protein
MYIDIEINKVGAGLVPALFLRLAQLLYTGQAQDLPLRQLSLNKILLYKLRIGIICH